VLALREPERDGVRVDSGIVAGSVVGTDYDPMIAKVVAWGDDRASALHRLDGALAATGVLGVHTNIAFLRALLADPDVAAGRLDTGLVERRLVELVRTDVPPEAVVAAALGRLAQRATTPGDDPFEVLTGWRVGGRSWTHERLRSATGSVVDIAVQGPAHASRVRTVDGDVEGEPVPASATLSGSDLQLVVDGRAARWLYATEGPPESPTVWVGRDGGAWALREVEPQVRQRAASASTGPLRAPMPGTVSAVHVAVGDQVAAGEPLVVVEAMKMEHVVRSAIAGTLTELYVAVADTVALDAPLAVVQAAPQSGPDDPGPPDRRRTRD
jgi:acetyl-CoA/propionyl-CoA carboxylase biotin carboxyl carrier protein